MEDAPRIIESTSHPPGVPPVQLSVIFEIVRDDLGGCRARFSVPKRSALIAKYGGAGQALAGCRDIIVNSLDLLIEEFHHEDETS